MNTLGAKLFENVSLLVKLVYHSDIIGKEFVEKNINMN